MRRRMVLTAVLLLASSMVLGIRVLAQDRNNDIIALNDATPAVDVIITPAPGTSGAVSLEVYQAAITVVDGSGVKIFEMADPRVHTIELRLAPNAGAHTLTAQRLPGVTESYVRIVAQSDLSSLGTGQLVLADHPLTTQQETDLPLSAASPSGMVDVSIPVGSTGTVTASFPGAPVMTQVVDANGMTVATLFGSQMDGLSLVLDGGSYEVTLLNTVPEQNAVATVGVMPPMPDILAAVAMSTTGQSQVSTDALVSNEAACTVAINVSSINLRSGPGTGYSVLDYGFRGQELAVGGVNPGNSWLLVGTEDGSSAWMSGTLGILHGDCRSLPTYDIPYREAQQPRVIVQESAPSFVQPPSSGQSQQAPAVIFGEHEDEHEGHDD